jgi:CelD/BcsL family acetyltransferase involved in cellulose biosynthesis
VKPHPQTCYRIEIAGPWQAVEDQWRQLGSSATPFQSAPVLGAWYASLGRRADVEPLCVRIIDAPSGEIAMLLPLIRLRGNSLRHIEFADLWAMDANAPALGTKAPATKAGAQLAFEALCAALPPADMISLTKMPASIGGRPNPFALLDQTRPSDYARHLCGIGAGWEAVLKGFDTSLRKNIQRQRRQLELQCKVRFFTAEDAECRRAAFDLIEACQHERLAKLGARHIFDEPGHRDFYRELVRLDEPDVILAGIECDGEAVAAAMLVCASGVASCLRHGYRQGPLERFGLGNQIIAHAIRVAHERGFRWFDQSIGNSHWKRDFGAQPEPLFEVRRAGSALGMAYLAKMALRRTLPEGLLLDGLRLARGRWRTPTAPPTSP